MSLTEHLLPPLKHMLRMLSGLLDKAQQQMPERADALLSARLAPDMRPLAFQVRAAALQAYEAVFRLRGEPVPEWLRSMRAEGLKEPAAPASIADARTMIDEALSFLDGVADGALDVDPGRPIAIEPREGIAFDMTGRQYARDWMLPQFYFHVTTAYAILRNQGLQIGKADYIPHMLAYLRPGSAPES